MQQNPLPSNAATATDRRDAAPLRALARAFVAQGNARAAADLLATALGHDPADAEAHFDLGGILYGMGRHDEAVRALGTAARLAPDNGQVHHNFGLALVRIGRAAEARIELDAACRLAPGETRFLRALALQDLSVGDARASEASFRALLQRVPDDCTAHRNLARLASYLPGDPHILAMERLAARPNLAVDARIELGFALFEALGKAGLHEAAFAHLAEANRFRRLKYPYDAVAERAVFEQLMSVLDGGFFKDDPAATAPKGGPIFIVGMPRAGTTLVEQILASHPDVAAGGESIAMTELVRRFLISGDRPGLRLEGESFSPAGRREMAGFYLSTTREVAGRGRFFTDKMPLNFRFIGIIAAILPGARFIHCRRDPVETCFSIHSSFFASGGNRYSHDLGDLADFYRQYRRLMTHWHAALPGRILDVDLAEVVANQEFETRRILDFLDLSFDPRCLSFHDNRIPVATLSSLQVKKPVYGGHADRLRPYLRFLDPLVALRDP